MLISSLPSGITRQCATKCSSRPKPFFAENVWVTERLPFPNVLVAYPVNQLKSKVEGW
jgi:hypothetical protein